MYSKRLYLNVYTKRLCGPGSLAIYKSLFIGGRMQNEMGRKQLIADDLRGVCLIYLAIA